MENQIQIFESGEFGALEILMIDGKPYFPATECAKILGYSNPQKAIRDHCKGVNESFTPSLGGIQKKNYIPEGDLYRLIIRSKLPAAERFEKFVFDEIMPSVRMYGAYVTDGTLEKMLQNPEFGIRLLQALQTEKEKSAALQTHVEQLTPKARYYDIILQSKNAIQVSLIAKDYGMSAVAFNKLLHDLKIQFKMGDCWILYQQYAGKGYTKSRTYQASENKAVLHTYWTQAGRFFLYDRLKFSGIVPLMESSCALDMNLFDNNYF